MTSQTKQAHTRHPWRRRTTKLWIETTKALDRNNQSSKRLTTSPIPREAGDEEKQPEEGRMEANH